MQHALKRRLTIRGLALLTGSVHFDLPLDGRRGERLLDVGCGLGLQTKHLAKRGIAITGLDKSEQAIILAQQISSPSETFLAKSVYEIGEGYQYDYVRMDNVLEHVADPYPFLCRLRELLKPGGRIVLFTPHADSWSLRVLRGKSVSAWTPEHLILYSVRGLKRLLTEAGFRITVVRYNSPAWWTAYNMILLSGLHRYVSADSLLLKLGSVIALPLVTVGQFLGMNEEMIVEARKI